MTAPHCSWCPFAACPTCAYAQPDDPVQTTIHDHLENGEADGQGT